MTEPHLVPEGKTIATVVAHRDIRLDTMRSYVEMGDGPYWSVHAVAWSPDGRYWASAGADETLCIWDVQGGKRIRRFGWKRQHGLVRDMVWSPDGVYVGLLSGNGHGREVVVVHARTGEEECRPVECPATALVWPCIGASESSAPASMVARERDPRRLWSAGSRYRVAEEQERAPLEDDSDVSCAGAGPSRLQWTLDGARNGQHLASQSRVLEPASGQVMLDLPHATALVAWSPLCSWLASVRGRVITVCDVEHAAVRCVYRRHTGLLTHVTCLSWSPSGQCIASGDSAGVVHLWRVCEDG